MSYNILPSSAQPHIDAAANAISNDPRFSFLKKLKENRLGNLRPLSEFFDKDKINFTSSFPTITKRWSYNLQYFSSNYLLILLGLAIYAIITNWLLVFTMMFIIGGFFFISRIEGTLPVGNVSVSSSSLYSGYVGASLVLLLISGAPGTVFWTIGAGALVVLTHAAILEPGIEDDFASGQV